MDYTYFDCPACHGKLKTVDTTISGKRIRCPRCGKPVPVPEFAAQMAAVGADGGALGGSPFEAVPDIDEAAAPVQADEHAVDNLIEEVVEEQIVAPEEEVADQPKIEEVEEVEEVLETVEAPPPDEGLMDFEVVEEVIQEEPVAPPKKKGKAAPPPPPPPPKKKKKK
jgi:hypothetical protein